MTNNTATLIIYSIILAIFTLLIIAYLISVTRKARLGEACLEKLGRLSDDEAPSYDTAYLRLHEIRMQDLRLDELLRLGMKEIAFREKRAMANDRGVA